MLATVEDCKRYIGSEFRRMLSRADLRERADALPGPPHNEPEPSIIERFEPSRPYDRNQDPRVGSMQRNELPARSDPAS